jgi:hypothetical protein
MGCKIALDGFCGSRCPILMQQHAAASRALRAARHLHSQQWGGALTRSGSDSDSRACRGATRLRCSAAATVEQQPKAKAAKGAPESRITPKSTDFSR